MKNTLYTNSNKVAFIGTAIVMAIALGILAIFVAIPGPAVSSVERPIPYERVNLAGEYIIDEHYVPGFDKRVASPTDKPSWNH